MKDLLEAFVRASDALQHAYHVCVDEKRSDLADSIRHAQLRVNTAIGLTVRDRAAKEATP